MPVEGGAGAVVAHGGAGIGVAGGDLDVAQVDASIEHRCDVRVAEHVRVHARQPNTGVLGEAAESSSCRVAVQPVALGVQEQRPFGAVCNGALNGPGDGRWKRDKDDLVALANHSQHAVTVLLAEVSDVERAGFELSLIHISEPTRLGMISYA